jgi:predicted CopG family antitoxin
MSTTIMVREDLMKMLNKLKKETGAKSYDELLRKLLKRAKRLEKTHFGTLPDIKSFEREELDRFD